MAHYPFPDVLLKYRPPYYPFDHQYCSGAWPTEYFLQALADQDIGKIHPSLQGSHHRLVFVSDYKFL